jgi:valyl-tRNA synthetase
MVVNLARLESLLVEAPGAKPAAAATSIVDRAAVFVALKGILDFEKEARRLEKEIQKLTKELDPVSKKLENQGFIEKAPEAVVEKVRAKQERLVERHRQLQANLDRIKALS